MSGRISGRALLRVLVTILVAVPLLLPPEAAAAAPVDEVPPSHITVCRDRYGGGQVVTVPFDEYVRDVLPFEFGANAPLEYLKAGAVAVKSYAWYHVENPYSSRCDLTDHGRHQHYRPGTQRTAASDAAVDQTWNMRMEEAGRTAYAQYCSMRCSIFRDGRHIDQYEARDQARAGWSTWKILHHHYRNMRDLRIFDWREPLTTSFAGAEPHTVDSANDDELMAYVEGIPEGHRSSRGHLYVECTIDGDRRAHHLEEVGITDGGSGPKAHFAGVDAAERCAEEEFRAIVHVRVNGWLVAWDETVIARATPPTSPVPSIEPPVEAPADA